MQAVPFTNTTNEDFERKWDGEPYTIRAGEQMLMEYGMAYSFARRLAVRECNKEGKLPNKMNIEPKMKEYLADKRGQAFETESRDKLNYEMRNLNAMKKNEMVDYAKEQGIEVNPQAKKEDIKETIESSFAEDPNQNEDTEQTTA